VSVSLKVEPPEGELVIDGKVKGTGSVKFDEPRGATLRVEARLDGYVTQTELLSLREDSDRLFRLEKSAARDSGAAQVPKDPHGDHHVVVHEQPKHEKATGTVRFVVTPWGRVTCGPMDFGTTPFRERELPVGTYECSIANPEYPTQSRAVTVKANEMVKVSVNFDAPAP
jgi:hypothetical protein